MLLLDVCINVAPPGAFVADSVKSEAHSFSKDPSSEEEEPFVCACVPISVIFGLANCSFRAARSRSSMATRGLPVSDRSSAPAAENAMTGGSSVSPDVTTNPPSSISTT